MTTVDSFPVGVTREDTQLTDPRGGGGGAVHMFIGPAGYAFGGLLQGIKGADGLPPWGSVARDALLRRSRLISGLWGSVTMKAATKIATRGYTLSDSTDSQQRLARTKAILESYGPGWVAGLTRGMQDYLGTNFGQVIAIERASNAPGARVTGLIHLDALRCSPTGREDYPLLYYAPRGGVHLLPAWGVIRITDMPDPDDLAYGYGQCAADRAWEAIIQDVAITTYFREKITGSRNLSIFFIRGIAPQQLKDALQTSETARTERNFLLYKGSTLIPLLSDTEIQVAEIPLASIPDGFEVEPARADIRLRFANAVGVAVQDIAPLSGQGLGTGTQSIIQDEAYEGMGLAAYPARLEEAINALVTPASTTFHVYTNDLRDQEAKAKVQEMRANTRKTRIESGEITAAEARQLALDDGDLPPELLQHADATDGGTLESDEKPLLQEETKETRTDRLIAREWDAAVAWVKAAQRADE